MSTSTTLTFEYSGFPVPPDLPYNYYTVAISNNNGIPTKIYNSGTYFFSTYNYYCYPKIEPKTTNLPCYFYVTSQFNYDLIVSGSIVPLDSIYTYDYEHFVCVLPVINEGVAYGNIITFLISVFLIKPGTF